jgi:hypothetical protein
MQTLYLYYTTIVTESQALGLLSTGFLCYFCQRALRLLTKQHFYAILNTYIIIIRSLSLRDKLLYVFIRKLSFIESFLYKGSLNESPFIRIYKSPCGCQESIILCLTQCEAQTSTFLMPLEGPLKALRGFFNARRSGDSLDPLKTLIEALNPLDPFWKNYS